MSTLFEPAFHKSQATPDRRKVLIRLIHVAKRELKLDDDSYRATLTRETSKTSCRDMSETELDKVLKALRAKGFHVKQSVKQARVAPARTGVAPKTCGAGQQGMIVALWLDLWMLGAVDSRDDKAINAFVKRQTGIENFRWLAPRKANQVIEGLKEMCAREGFFVREIKDEVEPGMTAKRELARVIYLRLYHKGEASDYQEEFEDVSALAASDVDALLWRMGPRLRDVLGKEA